MGLAESMRQEWDSRARKDAYYYIATWRKEWDVPDFLKSGEEDYEHLVVPSLKKYGFLAEGKTMLELGCGAGRMSHCFAARFGHLIAVDISPRMLDHAREVLHGIANVTLVQSNGIDLSPVPDESVDFVFSYLVLQHLPERGLVQTYIGEILRILRIGGICLFQFHSTENPTMNRRGRIAWTCVNALWSLQLRGLGRHVARTLRLDPHMVGKSWHGAPISASAVAVAVKASGGAVLEMQGPDTPMAWCCARKIARVPKLSSR
jgi:SAM-dependent methyltransferase